MECARREPEERLEAEGAGGYEVQTGLDDGPIEEGDGFVCGVVEGVGCSENGGADYGGDDAAGLALEMLLRKACAREQVERRLRLRPPKDDGGWSLTYCP